MRDDEVGRGDQILAFVCVHRIEIECEIRGAGGAPVLDNPRAEIVVLSGFRGESAGSGTSMIAGKQLKDV
jgi:hypothetical protein